jgi:hypothetical protein
MTIAGLLGSSEHKVKIRDCYPGIGGVLNTMPENVFYLAGGETNAEQATNVISGYSLSVDGVFNELSLTPTLTTARKYPGSTVFTTASGKKYLVVAGGCDAGRTASYNTAEVFPINVDTGLIGAGTNSSTIAASVYSPAVVVCNGFIVVLGGVTIADGTTSGTYTYTGSKAIGVYTIDSDGTLSTNKNTDNVALTSARVNASAVVVGNKIVLAGTVLSATADDEDATTEMITINADGTVGASVAGPSLTAALGGVAVSAYKDYVICAGGYDVKSSDATASAVNSIAVLKVDEVANTLTSVTQTTAPTLSVARAFAGAATVNGYVAVVGGAASVTTATGQIPASAELQKAVDIFHIDDAGQVKLQDTQYLQTAIVPAAVLSIGDYAVSVAEQSGTSETQANNHFHAIRVIPGAAARISFAFGGDVYPADESILPEPMFMTVGAEFDPDKDFIPKSAAGYSFQGWYMDKTLFWPYNYSEVLGTIILYAKYTQKKSSRR